MKKFNQEIDITPLVADYSNLKTSGRYVVEASAGTGKTFSILRIHLRFLLDRWAEGQEIEIDRLLLVTFTNAATHELKERLLGFLQQCYAYTSGQLPADKADESLRKIIDSYVETNRLSMQGLSQRFQLFLADFDRAPVHTIHAFCGRIQTEWFPQVGMPIEHKNRVENKELLEDICKDYWRRWVHSAKPEEAIIAQYIRAKFGKPVNDDNHKVKDSLYKAISGIEKYLAVDIKPAPLSWQQINPILQAFYDRFVKLKQAFEGQNPKEVFLTEFTNIKYDRNSLSRSVHSANYINKPFDFGYCDRIRFLGTVELLKKAKSAKKKDYEAPAWADLIDQLMQAYNEYEQAQDAILSRVLTDIHQLVVQKCQKENLSTHDLDIKLSLQGLQQSDELAQKLGEHFPCILVDEFQDTDKAQFELFDLIFRASKADKKAMYFIGDPKQSIYRFRNADINTYLAAKKQADLVYTLGTNFRSSAEAVSSVNELFRAVEHLTSAFDEAGIPFKKVNVKGTAEALYSHDNSKSTTGLRLIVPENPKLNLQNALAWIANEIDTYLNNPNKLCFIEHGTQQKRNIAAKDIAVIVGKHQEAQELKELLEKRNISSVVYSKPTVYASEEARWLNYLIDAIIDPKNMYALKRALSTPFFAVNMQDFMSWTTQEEPDKQLLEYQDLVTSLHKYWSTNSVVNTIQKVLNTDATRERIVGLDQGDRAITNILQLAELLESYEQEKGATPTAVSHYLKLKRQRASNKEENEEEEVRLDTDDALVKIMTIFRSKGLEFPIVFTALNFSMSSQSANNWIEQPNASTAVLTKIKNELAQTIIVGKNRRIGTEISVLGKPFEPTVLEYQDIDNSREAIRKFYVGLTRAKYQTVVVEFSKGNAHDQPIIPAYLLLKPSERIKQEKKDASKPFNSILTNKEKAFGNLALAKTNFSIEALSTELEKVEESGKSRENASEANSSVTPKTVKKNVEYIPAALPQLAIKPDWLINSYSGLNKYMSYKAVNIVSEFVEEEPKDVDQNVMEGANLSTATISEQEENSIFDFEKGANAGTFLHQLFEDLDFHRFREEGHRLEVIRNSCKKHGYDQEIWLNTLDKTVQLAMAKTIKIGDSQIQLGSLQPNQILREMEFMFNHNHFDLKALLQVVQPNQQLLDEHLPAFKGHLMGFIDLCFMHNGKVYILDYKSNYLGNSIENYTPDKLADDMQKHRYDLQFHIYAYALHRMLQNSMAGYNYEQHYGGVCYMYLRGLDLNANTGLYTNTTPTYATIKAMDVILGAQK